MPFNFEDGSTLQSLRHSVSIQSTEIQSSSSSILILQASYIKLDSA
ncbi:hypothetical protein KP509_22G081600 [Ceratopteris richardii]|uniref:Uncharacterized protein n=1 Tax=Ceratopteris richardii TaxID=49495 RepID=A0A8T2S7Z8_CERRI|nr:hypothetical protein KP509_22G081600 [Ceratopteris richardii]